MCACVLTDHHHPGDHKKYCTIMQNANEGKLNNKSPEMAQLMISIAKAERHKIKGDFRNADKEYKSAVAILERCVEAYRVFRKKRPLTRALAQELAQLEKIDFPKRLAGAIFTHGNLLEDWKKFDLALVAYRRVLTMTPRDADVHAAVGNVLAAKGDGRGAIAAYGQAIVIDPRNRCQLNLGVALHKERRVPEAIQHYRIAAANDPDDFGILRNLGMAYINLGQHAKATVELERAIKVARSQGKRDDFAHMNLEKCKVVMAMKSSGCTR